MDNFSIQNQGFFIEQVKAFEAEPSKGRVARTGDLVSDTLIGARVRPLLVKEADAGQVVAVSARSTEGTATVHELRAKVNGKPAINVTIDMFAKGNLNR